MSDIENPLCLVSVHHRLYELIYEMVREWEIIILHYENMSTDSMLRMYKALSSLNGKVSGDYIICGGMSGRVLNSFLERLTYKMHYVLQMSNLNKRGVGFFWY